MQCNVMHNDINIHTYCVQHVMFVFAHKSQNHGMTQLTQSPPHISALHTGKVRILLKCHLTVFSCQLLSSKQELSHFIVKTRKIIDLKSVYINGSRVRE